MKAEIISVGTEILLGSILNSNQQFLSRACAELGIDVYYHTTVGDNPARLGDALHAALLRSDLVITTGGLGPTADDVTLESAARALGFKLEMHSPTLRAICKVVSLKSRRLTAVVRNQALAPAGSRVFSNRYGTAPGILKAFDYPLGKRYLLLLPGPPREMGPMFDRYVRPALRRIAGSARNVFISRSLRIYGVPEAAVAEKVDDLLRLKPPVTMGIYARPAEVELKIMAKGADRRAVLSRISRLEKTVRRRLGGLSVFSGEETLEERLGDLLRKRKRTLAAAESCTGGYFGQLVTAVSGASDYFTGSITAYQNRVKTRELGISEDLLRKKGAVSAECAGAMAEGVRRRLGSGLGVSITGIAGPTGGSPAKPVGLVYVGLSDGSTRRVRRYFFIGKREEIRFKAARSALLLLVEHLERRLEPESPNALKNQVRI